MMIAQKNEKIKLIVWIVLACLLGIFLASLVWPEISSILKPIAQTQTVNSETVSYLSQPDQNNLSYFTKDPNNKNLKINAEAYLIGDLETGEIILAKNKDKVYPMASVSKLMTALVASQNDKIDNLALVSKKALATSGQNGNFYLGEKIKINDLLYPLLLSSSNDAAEIIAEFFNRNSFMKEMNEEAEALGMERTFYEDPSGLSANNQSTAADLFKLASYIKKEKNDLFQITLNRSYSNKKHNWFSNNQFLREKGYSGGKSGYTDLAKQTVVSTFSLPLSEFKNRDVAIILLKSKDRYKDVKNILNYLYKNVYYGKTTDAGLAWVEEKEKNQINDDSGALSLLFAGDIMLDRGVESSVNKNYQGDFSKLFDNLSFFRKADIVFANLEGPAANSGTDRKNLYSFRMNPAALPALKEAGIDIVSVANNHAGDWNNPAFEETLNNLTENEIAYTGGNFNKESASQPTIIEKYGVKIGFLAFSDVGPEWLVAKDDKAGILLASDPNLDSIIQKAASSVDYLIVSFHFGEEYKNKHNLRQETLAHRAIDNGAKIVVGHHPHVIQDTETYKNGFIIYSLGNFIFDQGFSEATMQGLLLEVKINRDGSLIVTKNISKQNKVFQPEKIIFGKEEKLKFE